jgi:cobalt-zinc-cadmium efflux system outer membrane protein
VRTAENERDKLELAVRHDVADALRRIESAREQSRLLKEEVAPRAESALATAEKQFRAGTTTKIEFLEAQRTYVEVRRDAAQALFNYRQAMIDIAYAIGTNP